MCGTIGGTSAWGVDGHLNELDRRFADDVVATFAVPVRNAIERECGHVYSDADLASAAWEILADDDGAADPRESATDRLLRLARDRAQEGDRMPVPGHEEVVAYAGASSPSGVWRMTLPEVHAREMSLATGIDENQVLALGVTGWDPLALWMSVTLSGRTPDRSGPDSAVASASFANPSAERLYFAFVSRLAAGLLEYADKRWEDRTHLSLDDAFHEDLLALEHTSGRGTKASSPPPWYKAILNVCDKAVTWVGKAVASRGPQVCLENTNPEYVACVGASQVRRMWPTVTKAEAFRWILEGGTLRVPDVTVERGDDDTIVIRTLPTYEVSASAGVNDSLWRQVMERRHSPVPREVSPSITASESLKRERATSKDMTSTVSYLTYLLCELVVHDLRSWYPEESERVKETEHRPPRLAGVKKKGEFRPRPHDGWERCLEACLMIALRKRLCGKDDAIGFGESHCDWADVEKYWDNRSRAARDHVGKVGADRELIPAFRHLHVDAADWLDSDDELATAPDKSNPFVEPWPATFTELG